ncbi:damage-control phosphatase ARMT1-like [Planococcus citri]|uniref:damage-control phosphatase ARMT1-like n=1 Tax=Planococcus citri TaxID=170843 RepID=UPI0031F9AE21
MIVLWLQVVWFIFFITNVEVECSKMFEHVVNSFPEINKPLSAKYLQCSAYLTIKERVPGILQGAIDDLRNDEEIKSKYGEDVVKEIETIVKQVETLKNGMSNDHPFVELTTSGSLSEEAAIFNKGIQKRQLENSGNPASWFQAEWLFAECYCYFKLNEIFRTSEYLNEYDYFSKVKNESLLASKAPILQLAKFINENRIKWASTEEEKKQTFIFLLKCSLWGNKADLSLSGGKTVASDHTVGSEMSTLDQNIIANDLEEVYELLNNNEDQIIDIVLDNAGFELFNDLCFADFLVQAGFAKKVIFHGKPMPWFVSDVTPLDFSSIFEILQNQFKSEQIDKLVNEWLNYLKNAQWIFKAETFWILPYDFSKMSTVNPKLYEELSQNKLIIFKGDLNYRKLVGDIYWEPTTSFKTALREFDPTNVVALRTVKADCVAGLREGLFEEMTQKNPNWLIKPTGEYALLQLSKKK